MSRSNSLVPLPVNVPAPLAERIVSGVSALAPLIGDEAGARRALAQAVIAVQKNPKLLNADPESFMLAVTTVAQWGLEIGTTAHLVPFYSTQAKKTLVTPIADYKGMIALAVAARAARSIEARVVYAGESFAVTYGTNAGISHVPDFGKQGDAKNITHAYAIARHGFSTPPTFVVLTRAEVEARRAISRNRDGDTWTKHYAAMAKKSAVRALCPMLPQSPQLAARLGAIIAAEDLEAAPESPAPPADAPELALVAGDEVTPALVEENAREVLDAAERVILPGGGRSFRGFGGKTLGEASNEALDVAIAWARTELAKETPHENAAVIASAAPIVLASREARAEGGTHAA